MILHTTNEVTYVKERIERIVGGFSASIVILYILVVLLILVAIKLWIKKNKVVSQTNHAELDEEYLNLTRRDNERVLEASKRDKND